MQPPPSGGVRYSAIGALSSGNLGSMEASGGVKGTVCVRMSSDEALVLFEWLHRHEAANVRLDQLGLEDAAERAVLWSLSGSLEKFLAEPFRAEYAQLLEAARANLRPAAE